VKSLSEADGSLLLAMRAWADQDVGPGTAAPHPAGGQDFINRSWDRLDPTRGRRLRAAWDLHSRDADAPLAAQALERLRRAHRASARVELGHVHPSWWVRALVDESPAVQRVATAALPESVRHPVQAGLLLDTQDLLTERTPPPEVMDWVLALWTERLVGGEPERPDDPPAIVALSRFSPRAGYGLCRLAGFCKLLLAGQKPDSDDSQPSRTERWHWLHDRLAAAGSDFQSEARREVQAGVSSRIASRHHPARLGLVTFGRLLADCEPTRVRWALQHWPYPIAKLTRSLMTPLTEQTSFLLQGETLVLKTVWDRLNLEGRLASPWPDPLGKHSGAPCFEPGNARPGSGSA
jgi:hypothetical protein